MGIVRTRLATLGLGVWVLLAGAAHAATDNQKIEDELAARGATFGGCSNVRAGVRNLARSYPDYHFAFAGRKAPTITGIKGCGYAWNRDLAKAQANAMRLCRKSEVEYGTDGGKWTCRLMK